MKNHPVLTKNIFFISLLSLLLIFTSGCKESGCTDPLAVNFNPEAEKSSDDCVYPNLSLNFEAKVGSEAFSFGTVYNIGGVAVKFSVAQFYVSGVRVGTMDEFDANPETYLLVKADQAMYEIGQITTGHKHMLMFSVGVDSAANHADPTTWPTDHPLAPQNPNMHWSWDNGYQFIKIEGEVDTDGDGTPDDILEMHIGKDSNLQNIAMEAHKEVAAEDEAVQVIIDFAALFDGIDLATERITHTGDDPGLAGKVIANVPNIFSISE